MSRARNTLRPYQVEAIAAAKKSIAAGRSPLLVMATGTGKTTVFSELVDWAAQSGPVVVLAHRQELIDQAAARITSQIGRPVGVEMAERRADLVRDHVVVASVQSLAARLDRYPRAVAQLLVIDEAHHAAAASYRAVAAHLGCPVLGVTATPDRDDRQSLAFDEVAFEYTITQGIADGVLVPPRQLRVRAGMDTAALVTRAGDYTDASAERAIVRHLPEWCAAVHKLIEERPTVMFTPGVETAHRAAELLRALGRRAESADGTTPKHEREAILARYDARETQVLVNCGLWTEGWDAPHTECVAMARPTKNRALFAQCVGRGLRPSEGKTECLVLDLAGASDTCDLVSVVTLLGANDTDDVVREATRRLGESGEALDIQELLELVRAAQQVEHQIEERDALAAAPQRKSRAVAIEELGIAIQAWRDERPPTEKQVAAIVRAGFAEPTTRSEASAIMSWLVPRWQNGLCSAKQARLLKRYGLPIDVPRDQASAWIDAIASNGWRLPQALAEVA